MQAQFTRALLGATVLVSSAAPALALDGAEFAQTLNAAYGESGGRIAYDEVRVDGDTVTLTGARLEMAGQDEALATGDLVFEGVEESGDGGYTADTVLIADIDVTDDEVRFSMQDIAAENVTIPADPDIEAGDVLMYETARSGPIAVTVEETDVFAASGFVSNVRALDGEAGYETDFALSDMTIDLSVIEDAKMRDALETLGYERLEGTFDLEGRWQREAGRLALSAYRLTLEDVGTLNLTFDVAGYTPEFIESLQELQEQAAAADDDVEAQQAMGMSMLGMMQQLTFDSATIRFEDASVTGKLLDYAGAEQGVSGEEMAQALKGMMPLALARLNNPDLQKEITAAVSTFLDDPQSLTVKAEPADPLPFAAIMGAMMGNPQSLPNVLNLAVTAND